jgi:hypothetical protein
MATPFSQGPRSRASRPFVVPISKDSSGSTSPFAAPSGNDRYLREADGWRRRFVVIEIAGVDVALRLDCGIATIERSDPGDRLFVTWHPLRLVDSLESNLTDGWRDRPAAAARVRCATPCRGRR